MKEYKSSSRPILYVRHVRTVCVEALRRFHPRHFWRNPAIFLMLLSAILGMAIAILGANPEIRTLALRVSVCLWLTFFILNFMEAFAEKASWLDPSDHQLVKQVAKTVPGSSARTMKLLGTNFCILLMLIIVTLGLFLEISLFTLPIVLLGVFFLILLPFPMAGLSKVIEMRIVLGLMQQQIFVKNRQALEQAGNIDTVLIDKRETVARSEVRDLIPAVHVLPEELAKAAYLASIADPSLEGKSIIQFVSKTYPDLVPRISQELASKNGYHVYRKGVQGVIEKVITDKLSYDLESAAIMLVKHGDTPLLIAKDAKIVGIVVLRETVKPGITHLFETMRASGISPIMLTGNSWTAASAIAKQTGVSDFQAEISAAGKLRYLDNLQKQGRVVAAVNLPRLLRADVTVAMGLSKRDSESADVIVEGDELPRKFFLVLAAGRKILRMRGALGVFTFTSTAMRSIAILPPLLAAFFPLLRPLDFLDIGSAYTALLSGVIYNMLSLVFIAFLMWRGCQAPFLRQKERSVRYSLYLYSITGVVLPLIGIKVIALLVRGG